MSILKETLTQKRLKELLHYNPDTGVFTWKETTSKTKKGMTAGYVNNRGYISIGVLCCRYLAHRLAFLYMTGSMPIKQCDHINHVRRDNKWNNLREVTNAENAKNRSIQASNTSGVIGVYWDKTAIRWKSKIKINDKLISLGYFASKTDAIIARKMAEYKHGFHVNHGAI